MKNKSSQESNKNELVERGEFNLALPTDGPLVIGADQLDADSVEIPSLLLMQPLSDQVSEGTHSPGQIVHSLTGQVYEKPLILPFAIMPTRRMRDGKVTVCRSRDRITGVGDPGGRCSECPHTQWINGEPAKCSEGFVFACYLVEEDEPFPVAVSMYSTAMKTAKRLNSYIKYSLSPANLSKGKLPAIELSAKKEQNEKGTYWLWQVGLGRNLTPDEIRAFLNMRAQFVGKDLKIDDDEVTDTVDTTVTATTGMDEDENPF